MSRRFDDLFPEGIPAAEVRRDLFGVVHAGRVGTVDHEKYRRPEAR